MPRNKTGKYDEAIAKYFAEHPLANDQEVGGEVGCAANQVWGYRRRHGIPLAKDRMLADMQEQKEDKDPAEKIPELLREDATRSNKQLAILTGLTEEQVYEWRQAHRKEICKAFGDSGEKEENYDIQECEEAVARCIANPTTGGGRVRTTRRREECMSDKNEMMAAMQDDKDTLTRELDKLIEERDRLLKENEMLKAQLSMMDGELNAERQLRAEYAERVTQPRELSEVERLKIFVADMVLQKGLPA